MYISVNYLYHVVCNIPSTYLSCNWKLVPFDYFHLISPIHPLGRDFKNMNVYVIVQLPAAAAKSLQSCLTPCNPIDSSPPGSPVPGFLQARTLEWVAISFSYGSYNIHNTKNKLFYTSSLDKNIKKKNIVQKQYLVSRTLLRNEEWAPEVGL